MSTANAERAVERILDDEALRGDLEDAGYGPLLSVVTKLADARAASFPTTDALYAASRQLLATAVAAASDGNANPLASAVHPLLTSEEEAAFRAQLPRLGADPNQNAPAIARALAAATGTPLEEDA